eukprot:7158066-Pyramimonas_sp.AAC.1
MSRRHTNLDHHTMRRHRPAKAKSLDDILQPCHVTLKTWLHHDLRTYVCTATIFPHTSRGRHQLEAVGRNDVSRSVELLAT